MWCDVWWLPVSVLEGQQEKKCEMHWWNDVTEMSIKKPTKLWHRPGPARKQVNPVLSFFKHPPTSNMCLIKTMSHILTPHVPALLFALAMPCLFRLDQSRGSLNHSHIGTHVLMLYLFMWHQGDGVVVDEAVLKGHCANLLRSVLDRNLPVTAPVLFLSLFTFFCTPSEIIKSSPETCKRIHHLESLLQKSFVVVLALIKLTAAAVMCDRNIYCGKRASGGSRPGSSWGWRIIALAFYVCALPRQTCFIRESPRALYDRNACLQEYWLQ